MALIGNNVKTYRKRAGLTQLELAEKVNMSRSHIASIEIDKYNPSISTLEAIAQAIGIDMETLVGSDYKEATFTKKGVRIPVLGEIRAGIPIEAITDVLDYEDISAEMAAGGEYFGLRVKGDSMVPVLLEGDTIIVRQQPEVENGETAIVSINGDEATVKKVKFNQDGSVMLIPNNPSYDALYFTKEEVLSLPVKILGKVVEIRRKL